MHGYVPGAVGSEMHRTERVTSGGLLPASPRGRHEHVWLKYGETLLSAEREGQSEEGDRPNSPGRPGEYFVEKVALSLDLER